MTKCAGCGALLQDVDPLKEGYVRNLDNKYCERCFKITHYNEYILSNKSNDEYLKKVNEIDKTHDLVIVTVDFLNLFVYYYIFYAHALILYHLVEIHNMLHRFCIRKEFLFC